MPVKNKNFPSNNNYVGEITSLNEKEAQVISKEVKTTDCAKKSEENTFTKTNTFSMPIKTDEIDNSLGNAMVRYKSTESGTPIVIGSSTKPLLLMGSNERPSFTNSGSDFKGKSIALLEDVESKQDTLTAGDGITIDNNVISATSSGGSDDFTIHQMTISFNDSVDFILTMNKTTLNIIKNTIINKVKDEEEEEIDWDTAVTRFKTKYNGLGKRDRFLLLRDTIFTAVYDTIIYVTYKMEIYPTCVYTAYCTVEQQMTYGTLVYYYEPSKWVDETSAEITFTAHCASVDASGNAMKEITID